MKVISPKRLMQSVFPTVRNGSIFNASSLDLQFARTKTLDPRVTFTRASSGTYVDSQGVIRTATTNEARFDHNPTTGESLGLLVEESRTNLFQRSEEFEDAYWSKSNASGTVIANQATSPDGASAADLYQEDTVSSARYLARLLSFTSGTSYTVSIWAKQAPGATRYLGLILPSGAFGANVGCAYTLSDAGTATITVSGTNTTASIQAFPGGWYRCVLSSQATVTTSVGVQIRLSNSPTAAAPSYTGDGFSGLYIWGAQLEAGSFHTSYMPTTTAAVTRSADVASISGSNFSSWYRQDEGTMFGDFSNYTNTGRIFSLNTDTTSNRISLNRATASGGNINAVVSAGGVVQVNFLVLAGSIAPFTSNRVAFSYKTTDFAGSVNGLTPVTQGTGTLPTVTQATLGNGETTGNNPLNGTIRRLTYWPQRLPNSTLQQITQ